MRDHDEYRTPTPAQIEALWDLVYEEDADAVAAFMDEHRMSPNVRLPLGDMPLLHAAIDSETERAIHDPTYSPRDQTIRFLLERGSDASVEYLGRNAEEAARRKGLRIAAAAFAEHARSHP